MGRPLAETIIPTKYREAHHHGIERFFTTREGPILNKRLELSALHRSGREFPVEMTVSVVGSGPSTLFHAFIQDVSDRKLVEQMHEDLTRTMVHDLRSPLTSIMGSLELVGNAGSELSPQQQRLLKIAEATGRRLLDLVSAILDVSQL